MSLFQKIHSIAHNRHDVNMYIYTNTTRERKEKNRTKDTSQLFLKRFICLVEVHYHKVNLNSDNQILHVKFSEVGTVLSPPCSNPSAAVLCHNSPEEVIWLVMKI